APLTTTTPKKTASTTRATTHSRPSGSRSTPRPTIKHSASVSPRPPTATTTRKPTTKAIAHPRARSKTKPRAHHAAPAPKRHPVTPRRAPASPLAANTGSIAPPDASTNGTARALLLTLAIVFLVLAVLPWQ